MYRDDEADICGATWSDFFYAAPEVADGIGGPEVDMWSLGVSFFFMICFF